MLKSAWLGIEPEVLRSQVRDPTATPICHSHQNWLELGILILSHSILKLKLKQNEADEGQVGPGTAVASTQTLTANLALILTPNLTLTANLTVTLTTNLTVTLTTNLTLTANITLRANRYFSYRLFKGKDREPVPAL